MLFVLGIGSLVALVNAVVTILWDDFPRFKYWQVVIFVCIGGYFSGLIYITPVRKMNENPLVISFIILLVFREANGC